MLRVFALPSYKGCLCDLQNKSFESKAIPNISFLFSDVTVLLSKLTLTTSFPKNSK